jgi:hypothetical protein
VALLPDPGAPDLLARLQPEDRVAPSPDDLRLFAAMPRRRSTRTPFAPQLPDAAERRA